MKPAGSLTTPRTKTFTLNEIRAVLNEELQHEVQPILTSLSKLIDKRKSLRKQRLYESIDNGHRPLFIKTTRLNSLASRLRVTTGLRRRSGTYDWPVAELNNHLTALQRVDLVPRINGYGFRRSRTGMVKEVFLIYENLCNHINGINWIKHNPQDIHAFIISALNLIVELNRHDIFHLDLWAANIMLTKNQLTSMKAIDLENCFIGKSAFHAETLGFQFAFLYQRTLKKYVSESDYDAIVEYKINDIGGIDRIKFNPFYNRFKHACADRKERVLIPTQGKLLDGKSGVTPQHQACQ